MATDRPGKRWACGHKYGGVSGTVLVVDVTCDNARKHERRKGTDNERRPLWHTLLLLVLSADRAPAHAAARAAATAI